MIIPEIKFERIVRECGWNKTAKSEGRKLLYDFRVLIDGQYRAYFTQASGKTRTWELYDVEQSAIKWNTKFIRPITSYGQKEFTRTIIEALKLIPTVEQIEKRRADEKAARERIAAEAVAEQEAEARRQWIETNGKKLIQKMQDAKAYVEMVRCNCDTASHGGHECGRCKWLREVFVLECSLAEVKKIEVE